MVARDGASWPMMLHHVFRLMLMRLDILGESAWHSMTGWKLEHPLNGLIMDGSDPSELGFPMLSYKYARIPIIVKSLVSVRAK